MRSNKKKIKEESKRARPSDLSEPTVALKSKKNSGHAKGNYVFPFVGEPKILFQYPIASAPRLGINFIVYLAMLYRKDYCAEYKPKVQKTDPEPKRSFLDAIPKFIHKEYLSFMGAPCIFLHEFLFDQDTSVRAAHFERNKHRYFKQAQPPEWEAFRFFTGLLLNHIMERIANIQKGVPDMDKILVDNFDSPTSPPVGGSGGPKAPQTLIEGGTDPLMGGQQKAGGRFLKGGAENSKAAKDKSNGGFLKTKQKGISVAPKSMKASNEFKKKLLLYQKRKEIKEQAKLRGTARWKNQRFKKVGAGFVFLESQEAFDFKYNYTQEAHKHRANLIKSNRPKAPLSFYDQFLKKKFKIPQFGNAVNPTTGQIRFFFRQPEYKMAGHHLRCRKTWWRRKSSQKFKQFYRYWEPLKSRFRVRYKFLQRRMNVFIVILKKLYEVSADKAIRLWRSRIKQSNLDGILGLEEFFRVFESRLFIVLSRFLIFQKQKQNNCKELVIGGALQVNGETIVNPFFVVPSFSIIKIFRQRFAPEQTLKKKSNLASHYAVKLLATLKFRAKNQKAVQRRVGRQVELRAKKKLKNSKSRATFLSSEKNPMLLVFSSNNGRCLSFKKKGSVTVKKIKVYKQFYRLCKKLKGNFRIVLLRGLQEYDNIPRFCWKGASVQPLSLLGPRRNVLQTVQIKKKKKKLLISWWFFLKSLRRLKSYKKTGNIEHKKKVKGVIRFLSLLLPKILSLKFLKDMFTPKQKAKKAAGIYKYRRYFIIAAGKERQVTRLGYYFKHKRKFFKKFKFLKFGGTFRWRKPVNVHHLVIARTKYNKRWRAAPNKQQNPNRQGRFYKQSRKSKFSIKLSRVAHRLRKEKKESPKHWANIIFVAKKLNERRVIKFDRQARRKAKAKTLTSFYGQQKELMDLRVKENKDNLLRDIELRLIQKRNIRPNRQTTSTKIRSFSTGVPAYCERPNSAMFGKFFKGIKKRTSLVRRLLFLIKRNRIFFSFWNKKISKVTRARFEFFFFKLKKGSSTTHNRFCAKKLKKKQLQPVTTEGRRSRFTNIWYKKKKLFNPFRFKNFFLRTIASTVFYYNSWTGYLLFKKPINFLSAYFGYRFSKRLLLTLR